jgi:hypothetical protein
MQSQPQKIKGPAASPASDVEVSVQVLLSDDHEPNEASEYKVAEFDHFLNDLDGAENIGQLLSMLRHARYRIAVEMNDLKDSTISGILEFHPKLKAPMPAAISYERSVAVEPEAPATEDERDEAPADSEAEQDTGDYDQPLTNERINDVTETIAHLMSLPLPDKLRRFIRDGLDEMGSGPLAADTSQNPDLLRIWLPAVLKGETE